MIVNIPFICPGLQKFRSEFKSKTIGTLQGLQTL